jgi:Protein of unknown function (DUF998)
MNGLCSPRGSTDFSTSASADDVCGIEWPNSHLARRVSTTTCWLAPAAVAGPVLFTLGWLVLGFFSPGYYTLSGIRIAPYSAMNQAISGLGVGPTAPFANTIFVLSDALTVVGVVAIVSSLEPQLGVVARRTIVVLLGLPALSAVVDGIFTIRFYVLHTLGFMLALTSMVTFPVTGSLLRRIRSWRRLGSWLILAGPLTLALTIFFLVTFSPAGRATKSDFSGLAERILVLEIMGWYVVMGWHTFSLLMSRYRPPPEPHRATVRVEERPRAFGAPTSP